MNFVSQLGNSVAYSLHQATYNPEAEAYSKEQTAAVEEKKKTDQKAQEEKKAKEAADAEKAAALAAKEAEESRKTFSPSRMLYKAFLYGFYTFLALGLLTVGFFGASYATNLNVYRSWQFQMWCAVYGFLFGIPVVLYSWYRWFYGHVDPYFGPLPLFKSEEASETVKRYFGFTIYDETPNKEKIVQLKEWEPVLAPQSLASQSSAPQ